MRAEERVGQVVGRRVVGRDELLRSGFGGSTLARAVASGRVRRVAPGLYGPVGCPEPADDLVTALHVTGGTACGPSAALLHGLDLAADPAAHHIAVPRASNRRAPAGCRLHRVDLHPHERWSRGGVGLTDPVRTVLDCARWLPTGQAVATADCALRRGAVTLGELEGALARLPASRTRHPVSRVVDLVDPRSESVLESLARVLLALAGLPAPEVQHVVTDADGAFVARVDFAWPESRLVVEVDGFAYHSDRRAVRHDRERANRLALLGWRVLRFGWEEVVGRPERVVEAVLEALRARSRSR